VQSNILNAMANLKPGDAVECARLNKSYRLTVELLKVLNN
jgi:hypothetical protein